MAVESRREDSGGHREYRKQRRRRVVKRGKDEMKVKRSERRVDVLFGDVSRQ